MKGEISLFFYVCKVIETISLKNLCAHNLVIKFIFYFQIFPGKKPTIVALIWKNIVEFSSVQLKQVAK